MYIQLNFVRIKSDNKNNKWLFYSILICILTLFSCQNGSLKRARHKFTNKHIEYSTLNFFSAISEKNEALVKLFIDSGINPNIRDSLGRTALFVAASESNAYIVDLLIKAGADLDSKINVNILDPINNESFLGNDLLEESTALMVAQNKSIAKLIIEAGSNVNHRTKFGGTAIFYLVKQDNDGELTKLLIKSGADINSMTKDGITPVYFAAQEGKMDALKTLIAEGAELENKTEDGGFPLYVAIQKNQFGCAKLLLDAGANVNNQAPTKSSPLLLSIILFNIGKIKTLDIIKLLLDYEADPNIVYFNNELALNGVTPLMLAAKWNEKEIVELLLKYGADINVNCGGYNVFDFLSPSQGEIRQILEKHLK